MKTTRTTKSGATITYNKTVDRPATKAIEKYAEYTKSKKEKKKKIHKLGKLLSRPKAQLITPKDAVKAAIKGSDESKLVTKGEEGYFLHEYEKERLNFLGKHNL